MRNLKIKNIDCHAALAMTRNAQSGRSMIEMLGVLAIIGVLSVGGIAGYSKAMQKYRINKTIEQITLIAGNIRAFWGPQKNYVEVECSGSIDDGYSGQSYKDGCPIHKKAKIFPDEMITVTDGKIMSITNPFGGGVMLDPQHKAKYGDNQAFSIRYFIGDNEEACIELASQDWSNAQCQAVLIDCEECGPSYLFQTPVSIDTVVNKCAEVAEFGTKRNIEITIFCDIDKKSQTFDN